MNFDWEPDAGKLSRVIECLPSGGGRSSKVTRIFKDGRRKNGKLSREQLARDLPTLEQIDLDIFYRPGNSDIRQWAYMELQVEKRLASIQVHGDYESFARYFQPWIDHLGLRKTAAQQLTETVSSLRSILIPSLFTHVEGALKSGQLAAALSAAVVYVEDRLRSKIGPAGNGLTGADLALSAFKNPGLLVPPLSFANNAEESAYFLLRGWMGLVRNLHGHQTSIPMTLDEARAQMLGVNYVLWVIENSQRKP